MAIIPVSEKWTFNVKNLTEEKHDISVEKVGNFCYFQLFCHLVWVEHFCHVRYLVMDFSLWNPLYVISRFVLSFRWHLWFCKALYKRAIMLVSVVQPLLLEINISVSWLLHGFERIPSHVIWTLYGSAPSLLISWAGSPLKTFRVHLSEHEIIIIRYIQGWELQ